MSEFSIDKSSLSKLMYIQDLCPLKIFLSWLISQDGSLRSRLAEEMSSIILIATVVWEWRLNPDKGSY